MAKIVGTAGGKKIRKESTQKKKPGTLASQHPRMQQMLLLRAPAILPPRTDTDPSYCGTRMY